MVGFEAETQPQAQLGMPATPLAWQLPRPIGTTSTLLGPLSGSPQEIRLRGLATGPAKQYWIRGAWPGPYPHQGGHRPVQRCLLKPVSPLGLLERGPGTLPCTTSAQCVVLLVCEAHGQGGTLRDLTGGERLRLEVRLGRLEVGTGWGWGAHLVVCQCVELLAAILHHGGVVQVPEDVALSA